MPAEGGLKCSKSGQKHNEWKWGRRRGVLNRFITTLTKTTTKTTSTPHQTRVISLQIKVSDLFRWDRKFS